MHITSSRMAKAVMICLVLALCVLTIHPQPAYASVGYALGPLSGQNGWNGGIDSLNHVLAFNVNTAGAADIVNTQAHTGSQSWYFAKGSSTPGAGTPFSPVVTTAGAPDKGSSGDMVVISFAFKAGRAGDGSRISINEGAALRDDRTGSNIYLESVSGTDYVRLYMYPASQTDVIGSIIELGHYSAADWHVVVMTTVYPNTSTNPDDVNSWGTTTYKVDGVVVGSANPWAHWWRYQSGLEAGDPSAFPYAPGSSIKFSNSYNDDSHYGFYFDDVSFRVISTTTHATIAAFSTSFESTASNPAVAAAPVTGTYTASFSQINVLFDEDMNDPSGNVLPDDVTNPANYLLFGPGSNGVFDTVECSTGLQGDDTPITVNSVSYTRAGGVYQAALAVNNAANLAVGQYRLLVCGTTSVVNTDGSPLNDEPGTDSSYDFSIQKASNPANSSNTDGLPIPITGFAPERITALPQRTLDQNYTDLGSMWLEIPSLGINSKIVGVPRSPAGWDVSWLGSDLGWLNGTAYPSWDGNAVLTGHVYGADGLPGPFLHLTDLKWGDRVILHANGTTYTYEVREKAQVSPDDLTAVTKHEDQPWLTLVTCSGYDAATGKYLYRELVRAVLIAQP